MTDIAKEMREKLRDAGVFIPGPDRSDEIHDIINQTLATKIPEVAKGMWIFINKAQLNTDATLLRHDWIDPLTAALLTEFGIEGKEE